MTTATLSTPDPFTTRREALCATLREEAAQLFTRWLAAHAEQFPGEPPIRGEEIRAKNFSAAVPSWGAYVDRDLVEDIGAGVPEGSPVDAILRLIAWLEAELAEDAS